MGVARCFPGANIGVDSPGGRVPGSSLAGTDRGLGEEDARPRFREATLDPGRSVTVVADDSAK